MDDLISEFIEETLESLSVLDGELVDLERNPKDPAVLSNIFRIIYTIKGACSFLHLSRLEALACASEEMLRKLRSNELAARPQTVKLILEVLDRVKELIDYVSDHGEEPEGDDNALTERLEELVSSANAEAEDAARAQPIEEEDTAPQEITAIVEDVPSRSPAALRAYENNGQIILEIYAEDGFSGVEETLEQLHAVGGNLQLDTSLENTAKLHISIPLAKQIAAPTPVVVEPAPVVTEREPAPPVVVDAVPALIVNAQGQRCAIRQTAIAEFITVPQGSGIIFQEIQHALLAHINNQWLPLAVLSEVLGEQPDREALKQQGSNIIVCHVEGHRFGIVVDRAESLRDVVLEPITDILKATSVYAASTTIAGQSIFILDPLKVAKTIGNPQESKKTPALMPIPVAKELPAEKSPEQSVAQSPLRQNLEKKFLKFKLTKSAKPKAVAVEYVAQIGEADVAAIECAADYAAIRYQGDMMRLVTLEKNQSVPLTGKLQFIVLQNTAGRIGMVVDQVADVVPLPAEIHLISNGNHVAGYIGSAIIAGEDTDIIDAEALLTAPAPLSASENLTEAVIADRYNALMQESL